MLDTTLLFSTLTKGTRNVSSPSNVIGLSFRLAGSKEPTCRISCGKTPIVGPDALKLRLGKTADLVSNFGMMEASASAFSRA